MSEYSPWEALQYIQVVFLSSLAVGAKQVFRTCLSVTNALPFFDPVDGICSIVAQC